MVGFGTSGIRGPWGEEVTPELGLRLGRALAHDRDRVIVGRDGRTSGPPLAAALTAGLSAAGADVTDAGVCSTPALAFAARDHDAGVVVTASHNPPADGGFKLVEPDGRGFGTGARRRIVERLDDDVADAPWDAVGEVRRDPDVVERHVGAVVDHVGTLAGDGGDLDLRVAVDGGHGPAGPETSAILERLGCRVSTIHERVDGRFPGRPSEPTPEHLAELRDLVADGGHDLGLAHDGDGDRLVAVTGEGRVVDGDRLLALVAGWLGADRVVCPVNTSMTVGRALPGARIVRTPIGDVHVAEALAREGSGFGGEPSGCFIFPDVSSGPDGPLAAAVVAAMAADRPLADRLEDLPAARLARRSFPVPEGAKEALMARLADRMEGWGETSRVDGLRIDLDRGWLLVRPSGTEPKLRLTVEAQDAAVLEKQERRAAELIERVIEETVP